MEANICDINHLDADVLLPPRKRLLAGFKKQNSDGDGALIPPAIASSSSSASPSSPLLSPPPPCPPSPTSSEFQVRLNNLLSSHFNNSCNLSPEQVVEASKSAADAAAKAAEAARAAAQEKAILAAKAVTAAKSALALVASFPEEAANKEKQHSKKNKLKKHVQVQLLYKKHQPVENYRDDEEFARKLHRVMNSSPRISKNSSSSGHKSKKPKSSPTSEKTWVSNGSVAFGGGDGEPSSMCDGHAIAGELDSEDSIGEVSTSKAEEKTSKYEKGTRLETDNGEAESKEKAKEDATSPGKKRGRLKLKRLPLSICSSRDQANPKDDNFPRSSPLTDKNMGNPTTRNKPLFTMEPSSADNMMPIDVTQVRKCQEFKAPACVKQNKVIQS